jgi:hypothetical protein
MGTCLMKEGLCNCFRGYAGPACEACATGFVFYNGLCAAISGVIGQGGSDDDPPATEPVSGPSASEKEDRWGAPGWVYAIGVVGGAAGIGAVIGFVWMGRVWLQRRVAVGLESQAELRNAIGIRGIGESRELGGELVKERGSALLMKDVWITG